MKYIFLCFSSLHHDTGDSQCKDVLREECVRSIRLLLKTVRCGGSRPKSPSYTRWPSNPGTQFSDESKVCSLLWSIGKHEKLNPVYVYPADLVPCRLTKKRLQKNSPENLV